MVQIECQKQKEVASSYSMSRGEGRIYGHWASCSKYKSCNEYRFAQKTHSKTNKDFIKKKKKPIQL